MEMTAQLTCRPEELFDALARQFVRAARGGGRSEPDAPLPDVGDSYTGVSSGGEYRVELVAFDRPQLYAVRTQSSRGTTEMTLRLEPGREKGTTALTYREELTDGTFFQKWNVRLVGWLLRRKLKAQMQAKVAQLAESVGARVVE